MELDATVTRSISMKGRELQAIFEAAHDARMNFSEFVVTAVLEKIERGKQTTDQPARPLPSLTPSAGVNGE